MECYYTAPWLVLTSSAVVGSLGSLRHGLADVVTWAGSRC